MIRLIAIVLVCLQLLESPVLASGTNPQSFFDKKAARSADGGEALIPVELGRMQAEEAGKATLPHVFLIQDAHASYEAQEKIYRTLDHLRKTNRIDCLLVEGAAGTLEPQILNFFEDEAQNEKLRDLFLKKGLISGVEKFVLNHPEITTIGLEDVSLYRRNLESFRAVIREKPFTQSFLIQSADRLERDARKILAPEALSLIKLSQKNGRSKNSSEYFDKLFELSKKYLTLDWEDYRVQLEWPNLIRLFQLKKTDERLPQEAIEKEWAALQNRVSPAGLERLNSISSAFERTGRFDPERIFTYRKVSEVFTALLTSENQSFEDYPLLTRFLAFETLRGEINLELASESRRLEARLLEALSPEPAQREILRRYDQLEKFREILSLEVTRGELSTLFPESEEAIDREMARAASPQDKARLDRIRDLIQEAKRFYEEARARETSFEKTALEEISSEAKPRHLVLVAGGFHAEGIQKFLKTKDIGFSVITPSFSGETEKDLYEKRMMGDEEEKTSSLPPARIMLMRQALSERMFGFAAVQTWLEGLRETVREYAHAKKLPVPQMLETKKPGSSQPNPVAQRPKLNFGKILAQGAVILLLAAFLGGAAGCTRARVNARLDEKTSWQISERIRETPPFIIPNDRLTLPLTRRLLIENNYDIKETALNVLIKEAEKGLLRPRWRVNLQGGIVDGKLAMSGGLAAEAQGVGIGGVQYSGIGNQYTMSVSIIFEFLKLLTGERHISEALAVKMVQMSAYRLEEAVDTKYLEAATLLIEIKSLDEKQRALVRMLQGLELDQEELKARSQEGLETAEEVFDFESTLNTWKRRRLELENELNQKSSELLTLLVPHSRDLDTFFLPDVPLEAALPQWTLKDLELMKENAGSAGLKGRAMPQNKRLAVAMLNWQAMVIAQDLSENKLNMPSVDIGALFHVTDYPTPRDAKTAQDTNPLIDGPHTGLVDSYSGAVKFQYELPSVHKDSLAAIPTYNVTQAEIAFIGKTKDVESEIATLFKSITQRRELLRTLNQEITKTEVELARRMNQKHLVFTPQARAQLKMQLGELRLKRISLLAENRLNLERLRVLGALENDYSVPTQEKISGRSLGESTTLFELIQAARIRFEPYYDILGDRTEFTFPGHKFSFEFAEDSLRRFNDFVLPYLSYQINESKLAYTEILLEEALAAESFLTYSPSTLSKNDLDRQAAVNFIFRKRVLERLAESKPAAHFLLGLDSAEEKKFREKGLGAVLEALRSLKAAESAGETLTAEKIETALLDAPAAREELPGLVDPASRRRRIDEAKTLYEAYRQRLVSDPLIRGLDQIPSSITPETIRLVLKNAKTDIELRRSAAEMWMNALGKEIPIVAASSVKPSTQPTVVDPEVPVPATAPEKPSVPEMPAPLPSEEPEQQRLTESIAPPPSPSAQPAPALAVENKKPEVAKDSTTQMVRRAAESPQAPVELKPAPVKKQRTGLWVIVVLLSAGFLWLLVPARKSLFESRTSVPTSAPSAPALGQPSPGPRSSVGRMDLMIVSRPDPKMVPPVSLVGRSRPRPIAEAFEGEPLLARTEGHIQFLPPANKKVFRANEPLFHVRNSEREGEIHSLRMKIQVLSETSRVLEASSKATEREKLNLQMQIAELTTVLNSLEQKERDLGTYHAPFPIKVIEKRSGDIGKDDWAVRYLPLDRLRLDLSVPISHMNFDRLRIWVNDTPARILNVEWGTLDTKNLETPLSLTLALETPLEDLPKDVSYTLVFENPQTVDLDTRTASTKDWKLRQWTRVLKRETIDVVAPGTSGRLLLIPDDEGNVVNRTAKKGDTVGKIQGEEFYSAELQRLLRHTARIELFLDATRPSDGMPWPIRRDEIDRLQAEKSKLPPLQKALQGLEVRSPADGLLTETSYFNFQTVEPGQKIGRLLTHRVLIGETETSEAEQMVLMVKNIPAAVNEPVWVKTPGGAVLNGKVIEVRENLPSDKEDLTDYKALRIEVSDPNFELGEHMPVEIFVPDPDAGVSAPTARATAETPGTQVRFTPSTLPLLAEMAHRLNPDHPDAALVHLLLTSDSPHQRKEGFYYLTKKLKRADFFQRLETLAFGEQDDLVIASLNILREEKKIIDLARILERALDEKKSNSLVTRLAYGYLFELIENQGEVSDTDAFAVFLQEGRHRPEVRALAEKTFLLVLEREGPSSIATLRILRSGFWKNGELLTLSDGIRYQEPALSLLLRKEIFRRLAAQKAQDRGFGFSARFIDRGFMGVRFTEADNYLGSVRENFEADKRFLASSPLWFEAGEFIDPALTRLTLEDQSYFQGKGIPTGTPASFYAASKAFDRPLPVPDFFETLPLTDQNALVEKWEDDNNIEDLLRLLGTDETCRKFGKKVVEYLNETPERRLGLARLFSSTQDPFLIRLVRESDFLGLLMKDAAQLHRSEARSPAFIKIYQDAFIQFWRISKLPAERRATLAILTASLIPSDFELARLRARVLDGTGQSPLELTIPGDELSEALTAEIERRSLLWAIREARRDFELKGIFTFTPQEEGTELRLLEEQLDVTSQDFSSVQTDSTPLTRLRDNLKSPRLTQNSKAVLERVSELATNRAQSILESDRPEPDFKTVLKKSLPTLGSWLVGLIAAFSAALLGSWLARRLFYQWRFQQHYHTSLSVANVRKKAATLEKEIHDPEEESRYEGSKIQKAFDEWVHYLQKDTLDESDYSSILILLSSITREPKLVFHPDRLRNPAGYDIESVGHLLRITTQLTLLTMRRAVWDMEQDRRSGDSYRAGIFEELKAYTEYLSRYRSAFIPFSNLKLTLSYNIPKLMVSNGGGTLWSRVYHRLLIVLNRISRAIYIYLVRPLYGITQAQYQAKLTFLKKIEETMELGNRLEPGLYDPSYLEASKKNLEEALQPKAKHIDQLGMKILLDLRRLFTRLLPFLLVSAPLAIWGLTQLLGWHTQIDFITGMVALVPGLAISLSLHLYPVLRGWRDNFLETARAELDALSRRAASFQKHLNLVQLELDRTLETLQNEKKAFQPTADVIVVLYSSQGVFPTKKAHFEKRLRQWLHPATPILFVENNGLGGGHLFLEGKRRLNEAYPQLLASGQHAHLPNRLSDAKTIYLLAGGTVRDMFALAEGSDALIPLPIAGGHLTSLEFALGNALKAIHSVRKPGHSLEVIWPAANLYIGPIGRRGEVTLISAPAATEQVDSQGLGVVIGPFDNTGEINAVFEKADPTTLAKIQTKNPELLRQILLDKNKLRQWPAFTSAVVLSFENESRRQTFEDMLQDFSRHIEKVMPADIKPDIHFTLDFIIPLAIRSNRDDIWSYEAKRTKSFLKNQPSFNDFYDALYSFYQNISFLPILRFFYPHPSASRFTNFRPFGSWLKESVEIHESFGSRDNSVFRFLNGSILYRSFTDSAGLESLEGALPADCIFYRVEGRLPPELPSRLGLIQFPIKKDGKTKWATLFFDLNDDIFRRDRLLGSAGSELAARLVDSTGNPIFDKSQGARDLAVFPLSEKRELPTEALGWLTNFQAAEKEAVVFRKDASLEYVSFNWLLKNSASLDYETLASELEIRGKSLGRTSEPMNHGTPLDTIPITSKDRLLTVLKITHGLVDPSLERNEQLRLIAQVEQAASNPDEVAARILELTGRTAENAPRLKEILSETGGFGRDDDHLYLLDAALTTDRHLERVAQSGQSVVFLYSKQESGRYEQMRAFLKKNGLENRVFAARSTNGVPTLINTLSRTGDPESHQLKLFMERKLGASPFENSERLVFVSSSQKESMKVSASLVKNRFYLDRASESDPELRAHVLYLFLRTNGVLEEKLGHDAPQDLMSLLGTILEKLFEIREAETLTAQAA